MNAKPIPRYACDAIKEIGELTDHASSFGQVTVSRVSRAKLAALIKWARLELDSRGCAHGEHPFKESVKEAE